jgi:alanine or glycine:cation symporter, AGCS family
MEIQQIFLSLNQNFTLYIIFPVLVLLGLALTFKLNFLQFTQLKKSLYYLVRGDKGGEDGMSNYQALSAVIAGNLGTGNISGMAVAIATGGPGALVWMWVMALLGSIIQYSSCLLGVKYRSKNSEGEYVGGPMYYLKNGLGLKKTAVCFSLFTMLAALAVGNFAQVNSMVLPLKELGMHPLVCGGFIAVAAALVMLGGVQRIAKTAAAIVPFMAIMYLGAGFFILYTYGSELLPACALMIKSAFTVSSFAGGVMGFSVIKAISTGLERGVFATDAGTGIVPILQSGTRAKDPVINGIVTLAAPFFVMVLCTMTGLILIVTGAFEKSGLESTNMVVYAFQQVFGSGIGGSMVISALSLFAYTTVIAWGGCAGRAAEFLWQKKGAKVFLYLYLALIPVGAVIRVDFVWVLADISISLMLVTNLVGIIGLSKDVVAETKRFFGKDSLIEDV